MVRKLICSKIFSELVQILGYCGKQKDKKYRKKTRQVKQKQNKLPFLMEEKDIYIQMQTLVLSDR